MARRNHRMDRPRWDDWDWWPLARLLTTAAVIGLAAHYRLGWRIDVQHLLALPGHAFQVFSFLTLLSAVLAHFYVVLIMFPLYAVITLNDAFYDFSHWIFRTVFFMRSTVGLQLLGLSGEIALFAASLHLIHGLLSRL